MRRLVLLLALLLTGCGGSTVSSSDVDWENYAASLKLRIDRLADGHRCRLLQAEFDFADRASDAQRNRVGDGNADLMGYIDQKMRDAGC